jgi:hypothetical protein
MCSGRRKAIEEHRPKTNDVTDPFFGDDAAIRAWDVHESEVDRADGIDWREVDEITPEKDNAARSRGPLRLRAA